MKKAFLGAWRARAEEVRSWVCVQATASFSSNHSQPGPSLSSSRPARSPGLGKGHRRCGHPWAGGSGAGLTHPCPQGPAQGWGRAGARESPLWGERGFTNASSSLT